MMSFMMTDPELWTIDDDGLTDRLRDNFGDEPFAEVLDGYRAVRPGESPTSLLIAITTDRRMRVPHIRLAEAKVAGAGVEGAGAPTFMYLFAWGHPDPTGRIRSGHGTDMPYFFDNLDKAPMADGPQAAALIRATCGAMIALAHTGDPNHDALPEWPTYSATDRATMRLDVESSVELDPFAAETRVWDDTELTGL
jgi:para-nitrobenzyl esterase